MYVEVGAGKGYLSSMLGNSFPVGSMLLVDSGTFRLKADRWELLLCAVLSVTSSLHSTRPPIQCATLGLRPQLSVSAALGLRRQVCSDALRAGSCVRQSCPLSASGWTCSTSTQLGTACCRCAPHLNSIVCAYSWLV